MHPLRMRRQDSSMVYAFTISPLPYPVLLVGAVVLLLLGISYYISFQSLLEDVATQIDLIMLVIPVLIVFILRWLWAVGDERNVLFWPYDRKYGHRRRRPRPREGSSPWGVAALLALLLVMLTFQSTFHDQWLIFGS
ncbi:unnamed protein product [Victoria cruziana]